MRNFTQTKSWLITIGITLGALILICLSVMPSMVFAYMNGKEAHEKYIYPIVRVTQGLVGGSGTLVYSQKTEADSSIYSTYILTNYHVIDGAITITKEWDSNLQKDVKKEKRGIVYVEIFKYRNLSTPIGTLKVEAEIVLYNKNEDMALIKLRSEEKIDYVAVLPKPDVQYKVMDETVACGCSLGFPPIPTTGCITRLNFQIDSLPFHMSSSQIIYGNSGGAMFLAETGELIGIPSLVPIVGWGNPVPHMGLFIPIERIYKWLEKEHYDFIFNPEKTENQCLEIRKKEIEEKKNKEK